MDNSIYITPDQWQMFVAEQPSFLTLIHPSAADAFKFTDVTITPKEERKQRAGDRGTLSEGDTIRLRRSAEVTLSGELRPSGSLGVAPDIGPFLKHIFGIETIDPGVSVIYSLSAHPEATLFGLSVHALASWLAVSVKGFVPQSLKISSSGENEATFEISGEAADVIQTGESTLAVAANATDGSISVQPSHGANFDVDSKIDIGSETGFLVSGIVGDVVSFAPNLTGGQGLNAVVKPTVPVGTTSGQPISGIYGSFTLDAATVQSVSHSVTLTANRSIRNKDHGSATPTGFYSAKQRQVTFENEIYLKKPSFKYVKGAKDLTQYDIVYVIGDTAGSRLQTDMNKGEFDIPPINPNNDDEAMVPINGKARKTNGEDEMTMTFN